MKKKTAQIVTGVALSLTLGTAAVIAGAREKIIERKGTVTQILMNPEGDADGLLLDDGTQVKFPPHLSTDLRATVALTDTVTVKGAEERGGRTLRADTITNVKSGKSLIDTPPGPGPGRGEAPPPPPPPRGGPKGPREGLAQLSVSGKIAKQLFGPRGDVNGIVLADGSIVRVGPRVTDSTKVSLDIGKSIRASGFGTKNEFGQALEATEITN